jgi:hypothetical protein
MSAILALESKPGRPRRPKDLQHLIREMAAENPTWGEERIANELKLKLGIRISPRIEGRPQLLQGPLRGRVGGHVLVENLVENSSYSQFHDYPYVKRAKGGRDHSDATITLAWLWTKGQPTLSWIGRTHRSAAPQVLLHFRVIIRIGS